MNIVVSFICCGGLIGMLAIVIYCLAETQPVLTATLVTAAIVYQIKKDAE